MTSTSVDFVSSTTCFENSDLDFFSDSRIYSCVFKNKCDYTIVGDKDEKEIVHSLPFNPLEDSSLLEELKQDEDDGVQFSHTTVEHLNALLSAGFMLTDIYEDTNGEGRLHELNIPTFTAIRVIKS